MTGEIQLFQVSEGPETHLVAAFDAAQARGVAFGHRYADPDEWGESTMDVEPIDDEKARTIIVGCDDDGSRTPAFVFLAEQRAAGSPAWLGGSTW